MMLNDAQRQDGLIAWLTLVAARDAGELKLARKPCTWDQVADITLAEAKRHMMGRFDMLPEFTFEDAFGLTPSEQAAMTVPVTEFRDAFLAFTRLGSYRNPEGETEGQVIAFILRRADNELFLVDTQGYDYPRYMAHLVREEA